MKLFLKGISMDLLERRRKVYEFSESRNEKKKVHLEMSVTQGDNESKSKLDVPIPLLRQGHRGLCREEGSGMDCSIEHLGIEKKTSLRRLGSKEVQKKRDVEKKSEYCQEAVKCFEDTTERLKRKARQY